MKLITEEINQVEFIVEEIGGKKSMFIEGVFLQTEQPNRNKRVYKRNVMEREVKRYTEQYIDNGRALGELGHPDGPTVNLDRVSHKIVSLNRKAITSSVRLSFLKPLWARLLRTLLKKESLLEFLLVVLVHYQRPSQGYKLVGEDFMLATAADIVADPSAPDAFVHGIMEGKEWVC